MKLGPVFTAQYLTDCAGCDEPIVPGEDARAVGDTCEWVHADDQCERVVTAARRGGRVVMAQDEYVCPVCFQERAVNGACGCDA